MKKLIGIILVIAMAFSLSTVALGVDWEPDPEHPGWDAPPPAEQEKNSGNIADATNLLPVDPNDITIMLYESDDDLADLALDINQANWALEELFIDEVLIPSGIAQGITVDAISQIGNIQITYIDDGSEFTGKFWLDFHNQDWRPGTDRVWIAQWLDNDGEFADLFEARFDSELGVWWILLEDIGLASWFWALIQRGMPVEAALATVLSGTARSPLTGDNSIHAGIILLIVLTTAGSVLAVSLRKAKQED